MRTLGAVLGVVPQLLVLIPMAAAFSFEEVLELDLRFLFLRRVLCTAPLI